MVCSSNCKKWTTFTVALVLVILGILFATLANQLFKTILHYQLTVKDSASTGFKMWKETPIPMYLNVYFFNWTNAEEYVKNPSLRPTFEELGPYSFSEHHTRENITFNNNNYTLTYFTKRTWKFLPDESNGTLSDNIFTLNPILAIMAKILRYKHYIVRIGANFLLEEKHTKLYVSKSAGELLFDGYDDPLIDLAQKLNISSFKVPFKKFGWFVDRNESITYDGAFNMNTGADDINKLGIIRAWNYDQHIPIWSGSCAKVNGTSGELWYPPRDSETIKIFSPDLCSTLDMDLQDDIDFLGIIGHRYTATTKNFDNGTLYPDRKCYFPEGVQPSGVRNVSECKYGAPALVSFAHFYLADQFYLNPIEGLSPDKEKHQSILNLEPSTGLPLNVDVKIQLNLLMQPVEGITVLANVSTITMPAFWFRQKADLTSDLASLVKLLLLVPNLVQYTGIGFIALGVLIVIIGSFLTYRKGWNWAESEEEGLLGEPPN